MMNTDEELKKYCAGIVAELSAIFDGTTEEVNEDGEQMSFYDYFHKNVLDGEICRNINTNNYSGCLLYVTLGGPTVWIDTIRNEVAGAWGSSTDSVWLPSEICSEINSLVEELDQVF